MKRTASNRDSPADRPRSGPVPRNNRSKIANGALGVDLRSKQGRRWRDAYLDALRRTNGQNEMLCRSLASLTVQHEEMDARLARSEPVETADLIRVCGAISRLMTKLGIVADNEPEHEPLPPDAPAWLLGERAEKAGAV